MITGIGLPEDLIDAIFEHRADDPHDDRPAGQIRMGATAYLDCLRVNSGRGPAGPADTVAGLHLVLDEYLPADAWRLCTANGDLIRDSREAR